MTDAPQKTRRRFRFRLRTLLLLPVLFAAAWWWVTWPERTARRFVQLLDDGHLEAAQAMIGEPRPSAGFWKIASSRKFSFDPPHFETRSWNEYLVGQRRFNFPSTLGKSTSVLGQMVACRNEITFIPSGDQQIPMVYYLPELNSAAAADELSALYPDSNTYLFKALAASDLISSFESSERHSADDPTEGENLVLVRVPGELHGEIRALMQLFRAEHPE